MKKHILIHFLFGLAVGAAFCAAVMLLWNWLMPTIFKLETITFWQALGLLALARILFGGMIGKRWERKHKHIMHHRHFIRNKFMRMSEEERKDFIKRKFLKHGFDHDFCQQNESEKHD
ncbi:MAG: hypothetical protein LBC68_14455 [Prevotellaceae bacterium]|jgi:hypothetical protein|nr:hypothetical protein [Prevotellaceae bacterium]